MLNNFFNEKYLKIYFKSHMLQKKGGGRDRMSAQVYAAKALREDLKLILQKTDDNTYKFSYYNEKLLLKSRNKLPRVLSVPTIRDRWVLGVLNDYIKSKVPFEILIKTPNEYIRKIKEFITAHSQQQIRYTRLDFSDFYNSINQSVLIRMLHEYNFDVKALNLIIKAIQTPTVPLSVHLGQQPISTTGVPQGLAISNILATIYLAHFDACMKKIFGDGYVRYVDDIMVLTTDDRDVVEIVKREIEHQQLELILNKEKTKVGILSDNNGVDFIGYNISKDAIGIRKSTLNVFENRLCKRCTELKNQLKNRESLPKYITEEKFFSYAELILSLTIQGFTVNKRVYGWLPYFREMNDMTILYQLDKLVKKLLGEGFKDAKIPSFVESYYSINTRDKKMLLNFDNITTTMEKLVYLQRRGLLSETEQYSEEEIEQLMEKDKGYWKRNSYVDISSVSN